MDMGLHRPSHLLKPLTGTPLLRLHPLPLPNTTTPHSNTPTLSDVSAEDTVVTTYSSALTLTCSLTNLDGSDAATVTWTVDGVAVSGSGYTVVQGTNSGGSQESTLEISAATLDDLRGGDSPAFTTFACNVTSGTFTDSDASETEIDVTILHFGELDRETDWG